jgi:hypothetical protein
MPAKVFISCGLSSPEEIKVAEDARAWLKSQGYNPFVALDVPTFAELNTRLIDELKSSEYYLFINFPRGRVKPTKGKRFYRGSLYTNQELAVALAFGFEKHMILLNHRKIRTEGVLGFLVSNTKTFSKPEDVLPILKNEIVRAGWNPAFSRQLQIIGCPIDGPVPYWRTVLEMKPLRIAHLVVRNARDDLTARNCAVRLLTVEEAGLNTRNSADPTRLKVMEVPGYSLDISPKHEWRFDVFGVDDRVYPHTFLLSERDVNPWGPIITTIGAHKLTYEVVADGFPDLKVVVLLSLDGSSHVPAVEILEPPSVSPGNCCILEPQLDILNSL